MKERTVKLRNLIMYGSGDFFGGGSFLIIGMLYLFFLTEVVGLPPFWASIVFAIGKIWDAISDPLMGYISDNTRSRFGRRRIYLLIGIIPIAISFVLLWLPVTLSSNLWLFMYYSFAYILFNTVFTMVMIPYSALNAEMTTDYKVRTRMSGMRIVFSQFSALMAGTLPKIIINQFLKEEQGTGYLLMAILFGILYALPWLFVFFGTWELPYKKLQNNGHSIKGIFSNFGTIFINRSFRTHIVMYICAYSAMDILMAMFAYYLTYYLGKQELYPVVMGSLLFSQIAMLPVYVFIANKKGKGFAYRLGLSIWGTGMLLSFMLSTDTPALWTALNCALIGAGLSAGVMIPWAILPSITDVDELISGKKRAGIYSGAMTLVRKFVQGLIAMPAIGVALELIGFVSNTQQSPETLQGMRLFFMAGPITLIVLGILVAARFKINPETHGILRNEINRLKEGGKAADADPQTREVCKKLTGIEYEKLALVQNQS